MRRIALLAAAALALAGCGTPEKPTQPSTLRETQVEWMGNQCFRFTSSIGTTILANPYAAKTGGRTLPSPLKSDVVLITSERSDFNNIKDHKDALEGKIYGIEPGNDGNRLILEMISGGPFGLDGFEVVES
jgi:ABC-type proline/glycine betaine transport system substrate-binding protein